MISAGEWASRTGFQAVDGKFPLVSLKESGFADCGAATLRPS
jgi:hypothetical protein